MSRFEVYQGIESERIGMVFHLIILKKSVKGKLLYRKWALFQAQLELVNSQIRILLKKKSTFCGVTHLLQDQMQKSEVAILLLEDNMHQEVNLIVYLVRRQVVPVRSSIEGNNPISHHWQTWTRQCQVTRKKICNSYFNQVAVGEQKTLKIAYPKHLVKVWLQVTSKFNLIKQEIRRRILNP